MRPFGALVIVLGLLIGALPATAGRAAAAPTGRIAYQGLDRALRIVGADGSGERVAPTRGEAFTPRWSPVEGEIVYSDELAVAPFMGQLVVVNADSGATRVLVGPAARDPNLDLYWSYLQPRWTPDGGAVVYVRSGGGRVTTVMRVPASGGTPQELFFATGTTRFDLSPTDGRFVLSDDAYAEERVQGSRLVVRDPDGTNERLILPRTGEFYFQPTWTPDGAGIVVRRQAARDSATATLVLVDPATGAQRALGTVAGGSSFAFSPDGAWIVLASGDTKRLSLVEVAGFREGATLGAGAAPSWEPAPTSRLFPETGFRVGGRFLAYWEANGALPLYGLPLTGERRETLEDGQEYTVQYFERARFELHTDSRGGQPIVLLGQFGRRIVASVPAAPTAPTTPEPGYVHFPETGHNVGPRFDAFWRANGGLPQFGYPLTEPFIETLEDGKPYTVQYFERARFEFHPENSDPQYQVLLGQFGRRILAEAGR